MPHRTTRRKRTHRKTRKQRGGVLVPLSERVGHVLKADTMVWRKNPERETYNGLVPSHTRVYVFEDIEVLSLNRESEERVPSIPVYTMRGRETPAQMLARLEMIAESKNDAKNEMNAYKESAITYVPLNELYIDSEQVTSNAPASSRAAKWLLAHHMNMNSRTMPKHISSFLNNSGVRRNVTTKKPYMAYNENNGYVNVYPGHQSNEARFAEAARIRAEHAVSRAEARRRNRAFIQMQGLFNNGPSVPTPLAPPPPPPAPANNVNINNI